MAWYKANFASERILGSPPYKGCGVSADWSATDLATLGESSRRPDGRMKGKRARAADLKRGWKGFLAEADSNGIPDTGDLVRIHAAMFPDLPRPTYIETRNFSDIINALDDGMAVSIAVRLSALPTSSEMRRYTSADHQVVLYHHWGSLTKRVDPMHQHSLTYDGDAVELADVRKAAKAIWGGLILAWLYPVGGWTKERLMAQKKNRRLIAERNDAERIEKRLRKRIAELQATVPPDCATEIINAKAAGRESAFVQVLGSVSAMRTTPE